MVSLKNSLCSKTILVVDDQPNNLQLLFNYLKNSGYKILIAQGGKKAIKTALSVHPDLILLDVMMPELDGFETCHRLKSNTSTKDIPIIFMTALSETEHKVQGLRLGAVDYITKPIEQEELLARIKTHLSLQSLHQHLAKDAARQKLFWQISDRIRQSLDLKSILQTATKEIKAVFDCDLVWITHLNQETLSTAAYSANEGINIESEETQFFNYLCPFSENLQYEDCQGCDFTKNPCHYRQLPENIQVIEEQTITTLVKTKLSLLAQNRLIIPILINSINTSWNFTTPQTESVLEDTTSSNSSPNTTLWGWLTVDKSQSSRQWETEEINFLKQLTNQLAIGIKQGLLCQELSDFALLDPLTTVYNRRYFNRQLNLEWRRLQRISCPLSIVICDVDCFKIYNDTYGHQKGDECLQQVAQAIGKTLKRPADIVARYGGEEFTVILPHTNQSGAIKVAEAMRVAVKDLNIPHHNSLVDTVVTISLGVASTIPNSTDDPALLIKAADVALYHAKKLGRDGVAVYLESISHSKDRQKLEMHWVQRLRQALKENLFSLYAQPIAPLEIDDQKRYFEILLRLTDEEDRVIAPKVFLDIAERNFLMPDVDTWVIDHLLKTLAANGNCSDWKNYCFSINLSGASLNSESFLEFLSQKLTEYHLPPNLFCFEVTETVAVSDLARAVNFLESLRNLGCTVALDDFGTGMSSLNYLKNLPIDYLKIDGSFIKELNYNKASKVIVEAINIIAEGMGLKTVAEFVENQTILDSVRNLKIDYAQGFHLGHPGLLMEVINHN